MDQQAQQVLTFWFGELLTDYATIERFYRLWFYVNPDTDKQIAEQFGELPKQATAGQLAHWRSPQELLALILVLDQFPRNLYRGSAQAFAYDAQALALCLDMIASGQDRDLAPIQRVFAYMPLQHAEDLAMQQRSVEMFQALCDQADEVWSATMRQCLQYAKDHRDIVVRFGRYPHRNPLLGRPSTSEEQHYMATGGQAFGQKPAG